MTENNSTGTGPSIQELSRRAIQEAKEELAAKVHKENAKATSKLKTDIENQDKPQQN